MAEENVEVFVTAGIEPRIEEDAGDEKAGEHEEEIYADHPKARTDATRSE